MENKTQPVDQTVPVDAEPVDANNKPTPAKKNPNMRRTGTHKGGRPAHGADAQEKAEQRKKALEYRMMGYSYDQISEELGISAQAAWQNVDKALKDIPREAAKEVLNLELGRLDTMFVRHFNNAVNGDPQALNGVMSIMKRRASLLGLDAPVKTDSKLEVNGTEGVMVIGPVMSPDEWLATAKKQQAELVKETAPE